MRIEKNNLLCVIVSLLGGAETEKCHVKRVFYERDFFLIFTLTTHKKPSSLLYSLSLSLNSISLELLESVKQTKIAEIWSESNHSAILPF